jgi:hypothetical protein
MKRCIAIAALCLLASPAYARDYDRNLVAEREVSVGFGLSPMDLDTRVPQACAGSKTTTCAENIARANVITVRGSARRHQRNFYLGGELELGAVLPASGFGTHPWIGLGGTIGLETSNNAWDRLRGYGELGVLGAWADTRIAEILCFTSEVGVRYQVDTSARPHVLLHLGVRGLYNFSHVGVMSFAGMSWTFD